MPSTGFYLFLQHKRNNGTDSQCSVSMPSTGFYLFLQIKKSPGGAERGMCQCPQRASTYFFRSSIHIHYCTEYGVNALNGLLLISSKEQHGFIEYMKCVNALNGLLLISSEYQIYF